jgi:parallel beta-helix repeat protein
VGIADTRKRRALAGRLDLRALSLAALMALIGGEAAAAWRVVSQIGGPISAVAAEGDIAYIAVGSRLLVYDLSNPASPREIGSTAAFGDLVSALLVSGTRLYVTAGTAGLYVLDVTDPAAPRVIGRWDSPGSAENIAVAGTTAYLADGPFGLQIVDLSDPSAPTPRGTAFDMRFAFDVVVQGQYAFAAGAGAGLLVADVADPARPRDIVSIDTPGFARDLTIAGDALYLADQWGGVRLFDIADPARPRETGAIPLPSWAFGVAVAGSTLYVADGTQGLRLFTASDASSGELGSYAIPSQLSWKVAIAGSRVLVAARGQGVHVVDAGNVLSPRLLSLISPLANARGVSAHGPLAFVATRDQGLRIVDLSDPVRPVERGRGEGQLGWAVLGDDRLAYICDGGNPTLHRLRVFDVGDPDRPREIATIRISEGICRDLVRAGQWLYVPNEFGVQVFDLSNPAAPVHAGTVRLPEETVGLTAGATSIALAGSTAFVPNARLGVKAIDVSDPRSPRVIGGWSSDPPVHVGDVDTANGFAYVVSGLPFPELIILDVRDPARPVHRGAVALPESGNQVIVRGSNAYVAAGASGVVVIDVRNPAAPVQTERIAAGYANALTFAGDRMLVAGSDGGLFVVEQIPGRTTTSLPSSPSTVTGGRRARPAAQPSGVTTWVDLDTPRRPHAAAAARSAPRNTGRQVVVTSAADSGPGTLREALTNLEAGDTITFDRGAFPPSAPARIRPATVLPRITRDGVTIDASNAGVILDGGALPGRFDSGLSIASRGNTIKGLQILNFPSSGIEITGNGSNVIGGDRARGSGPSGEGNVISRNARAGITVLNPNNNRIVGNYLGTDVAGRTALGRQERGVWIFAQPGNGDELGGDRIGGSQPWEANVIAGNEHAEVSLQNTRGHTVIGNYLGTDPSGTNRVGSTHTAISVAAADNIISGNVIIGRQHAVFLGDPGSCCNQISNNWIGVTKSGSPIVRDSQSTGVNILESFNLIANNVVGGVQYGGVSVSGYQSTATETVIIGNRIGTGLGGARPERWGVSLEASSRTFIGGSGADGNVVSGNVLGLWIRTPGVDRTFVLGNFIGVDGSSGRVFRNTGDGIDIGGATSNFVQGNVIAENGGRGVVIAGARNRLRRNSIYANAGGGITAPAAGGIPSPPVILAAAASTVGGTACPQCMVEIYSDDGAQGRWFEGGTTADAGGRFSLTRGGALRGPNITAVAVDSAGSTSAFSNALRTASSTSGVGAGPAGMTAGAAGAATAGARHASIANGENAPLLRAFMAPVVRDAHAGRDTTLSLVNPHAVEIELALSLRGADGRQVRSGASRVRLRGHTRSAPSIGELFPEADTSIFQGTVIVVIAGTEGLAATTVHSGPDGQSTELPVVPLDRPNRGELMFPFVGAGAGFSSSLIVMNPLNAPNSGEIAFFDESGSPLPLYLGGERLTTRFIFALPPYGSAAVSTDGAGRWVTGSARVTSGSLQIAAAIIFGSSAGGRTGGGPADPASELVIPITRSAAIGVDAYLGVASAGGPVSLRLTLTDRTGAPLVDGQRVLVLQPHAHTAGFIEHMLPGAGAREFDGLLIVKAEVGAVVATAMRVGPRPDELSMLTLTSLRADDFVDRIPR